jgi:hypothetical protein
MQYTAMKAKLNVYSLKSYRQLGISHHNEGALSGGHFVHNFPICVTLRKWWCQLFFLTIMKLTLWTTGYTHMVTLYLHQLNTPKMASLTQHLCWKVSSLCEWKI